MYDNIPATEYQRVYRRALLLLEGFGASDRLDLHELAHRITERYFRAPDDLTRLVALYLKRARRRQVERYRAVDVAGPDLRFNALEAAHDLLVLYLEGRALLTYEERYLYCHLLAGATFEETARDLGVSLPRVHEISEHLYRKLREPHAATAQENPSWLRLRLLR